MKCAEIREQIALNRHLHKEGSLSQEIIEHIEKCEECKKYYDKMKLVDSAFSILEEKRDVEKVPSFLEFKENKLTKFSKFKKFYLDKVAVAAIFVLFIAYFSGLFMNNETKAFKYAENEIDAQYKVPLSEDVTVDLNFNSKTELKDVTFTLELGDGLKFGTDDERYQDFKEFTRKIDLKQGENKLSFAVIFDSSKPSFINAVLSKNGKKFTHKILFEPDLDKKQIRITYLKVVVEKESA